MVDNYLRTYLRDCFEIANQEMTTSELLVALQYEIPETQLVRLQQLLNQADLVKFAQVSSRCCCRTALFRSYVALVTDDSPKPARTADRMKERLLEFPAGTPCCVALVLVAGVAVAGRAVGLGAQGFAVAPGIFGHAAAGQFADVVAGAIALAS